MTQALETTRWWLVIVLPSVTLAWVVIAAGRVWSSLTIVDHLMIVLSLLSLFTAIVLRSNRGLWLAAFAYIPLVICAFLGPEGAPPWLAMPNLVGNAAYLVIMLTPRRIGWIFGVVAAFVFTLVWRLQPSDVVMWAPRTSAGWIVIAQLFWACCMLWWTWHRLVRDATDADGDYSATVSRTRAAVEAREADDAWRTAAVRVHETVLNTIRYVALARPIDRAALRTLLDASTLSVPRRTSGNVDTVRAILDSVIEITMVDAEVRLPARIPELQFTAQTSAAVREALVELIRNAAIHGLASRITIAIHQRERAVLQIEVSDNGRGVRSGAAHGFGLSRIIGEGLEGIGAEWSLDSSERGTTATMMVPLTDSTSEPPMRRSDSDYGRLLISAVIGGTMTVGLLWFVLIASQASLPTIAVAFMGAAGALATLVLLGRHRRVGAWATIAFLIGPVAFPWALALVNHGCAQANVIAGAFNVSGYAVILVATWGRGRIGALGVLAWSIGGVALMNSMSAGCRTPTLLAEVNSLLTVPVLLIAVSLAARVTRRARQRRFDAEVVQLKEAARARTTREFVERLSGSIGDANVILEEIADGAIDDAEAHRRLEIADARIRMLMQVDPQRDGAMTMLAAQLVDAALRAGSRVNVRAINGSSDRTPLDPRLGIALGEFLERSVGEVTIQVFQDEAHDYLTLTLTDVTLPELPDIARAVRGVTSISVDVQGSADSEVAIMVTRSVMSGLAVVH